MMNMMMSEVTEVKRVSFEDESNGWWRKWVMVTLEKELLEAVGGVARETSWEVDWGEVRENG